MQILLLDLQQLVFVFTEEKTIPMLK